MNDNDNKAVLSMLASMRIAVHNGTMPIPGSRELAVKALDAAIAALAARPVAAVGDGYRDAFYEIAVLLGLPAQSLSPREVWETQMRPQLIAALASPGDAQQQSSVSVLGSLSFTSPAGSDSTVAGSIPAAPSPPSAPAASVAGDAIALADMLDGRARRGGDKLLTDAANTLRILATRPAEPDAAAGEGVRCAICGLEDHAGNCPIRTRDAAGEVDDRNAEADAAEESIRLGALARGSK